MIIEIKCTYGIDNIKKRKFLKKIDYISSVKISKWNSRYGIKNIYKAKELLKKSKTNFCIKLNINGTIKYWFSYNDINDYISYVNDINDYISYVNENIYS